MGTEGQSLSMHRAKQWYDGTIPWQPPIDIFPAPENKVGTVYLMQNGHFKPFLRYRNFPS
jgi:hypothetical protein